MKNCNGQGSISFEKDRNTYRAAIVDPQGTRIRKRFATKQEAEEWLTVIRASFYTNTYIPKSDYTLGEWIIEYLETYVKGVMEISTLATYKLALTYFDAISGVNLTDLTSMQLQKYFNTNFENLNATRYNSYIVLNTTLKKAVSLGVLNKNPMENVTVKPPEREEVTVFTQDELQAIFNVCQTCGYHKRYYPLILLAATTGMRLGEITGLKWSNVHETYINITNSLKYVDSQLILGKTKTPKSKRIVSIPKYVYDEMQKLGHDCEYVFHTKNNTPLSPSNLDSKIWPRILRRAKVEYKKFHTLRHTHATMLLHNGVPIPEISKRLGHKNISTTLDVYSHFMPQQDDVILDKISNIYGLAPTLPL